MSAGMIFILGAGFTRAFVPKAPLLVDDYQVRQLREDFNSFGHAATILDDALAQYTDGRVDIERLMTRISGMPYDALDDSCEFALLDTALRKKLVDRISDAKAHKVEWEQLETVARYVLRNEASIVTFNYDDVLDQSLWKIAKELNSNQPSWHPDGGYGFYCRPSYVCVKDTLGNMDQCRSLVLKLHGSINWRSRLGEGTSRGPAAILHHENDWQPRIDQTRPPISVEAIESHLEPDPFIVPPVLVKAGLTTHPVLRVVWKLAYERLKAAKTVVFIGYSLPETDLASRILFGETLKGDRDVRIVNLARDEDEKKRIKNAYEPLFPNLPDANFDFGGASDWVENRMASSTCSAAGDGPPSS